MFGYPVREFKVELGNGELARMVFRLPWYGQFEADEAELTHAVRALVRGWDDDMQDAMVAAYGAHDGIVRWRAFMQMADVAYRSATPVAVAVEDCLFVKSAADQQVRLEERDGLRLRLLKRGGRWTLAELMPLVDSCGLKALSEETFQLGDVWVHDVLCAMPDVTLTDANRAALVAVVDACLRDILEEDSLNRLALGAAMGVREIGVWRGWVAYMQQVDRRLDPRTVRQLVRSRPDLARTLWELFAAEHTPEIASSRRNRLAKPLEDLMQQEILAMATAEEERVWRTAYGVVKAIVRTNVWQPGRETANGGPHGAEAIEICKAKSPDLVIMDVHMPIKDGIEAAGEIGRACPTPAPGAKLPCTTRRWKACTCAAARWPAAACGTATAPATTVRKFSA